MSEGVIRIGVSGWTHAPWRGAFYPKELKRGHELRFLAGQFRTVEVSGTFYGMQRPETFGAWADQVAADFIFAVKGPRAITHVLRLRDAEAMLANFIASGLLRLGLHLGPILWQLPPNLRFDADRIERFLALLPRTASQAAALGRRHHARFDTKAWLEVEDDRPLRHAIDVRHESFRTPAFIDLLRRHNVALVCAESPGIPPQMDLTADFVYCRLHGQDERPPGGYNAEALNAWAGQAKAWSTGREPDGPNRIAVKARPRKRSVFIYFDNTMKTKAPFNALELIRRLRT